MFKLLSAFVDTPKKSPEQDEVTQQLTRFAPKHIRDAAPMRQDASHNTDPVETAPVAALRPITRAGLGREPKFNEMAHLYTDSRVSISVLRRALPGRFSAPS